MNNYISTNKLLAIVKGVSAWQPITLRGLYAIVLSVFALEIFALRQSDLIASILGGSIVMLLLFAIICILVARVKLGKSLKVEVFFSRAHPVSNSYVEAGIEIHNCSIPPLCRLTIQRIFENKGAIAPIHVVKGSSDSTNVRRLIDSVVFPHRGLWKVSGLKISIADALGFVSLEWTMPIQATIDVSAQDVPIVALPVLATSSKSGDIINQASNRTGDLFDIKQYDPSDGVKKILWKTFAKTGSLVVRRPEPAVIPEGEIAVYLVAGAEDDHVAGALQSYLRQLENQDINVLFGTDGICDTQTLRATDEPTAFLIDPESIKESINRTVWSSKSGTAEDFLAYVEALQLHFRFAPHILVFGNETSNQWSTKVIEVAERLGIKISIAVVPEKLKNASCLIDSYAKTHDSLTSGAKALLYKGRTKGFLDTKIKSNPNVQFIICESYLR